MLTGEVFVYFDRFCHYFAFLLFGQSGHVFVRIAVQATGNVSFWTKETGTSSHLMAGITDFGHLCRKGKYRVAGHEPGGFDIVLAEKLQQSICAGICSKYAARYIRDIRASAVCGIQPVRVSIMEYLDMF